LIRPHSKEAVKTDGAGTYEISDSSHSNGNIPSNSQKLVPTVNMASRSLRSRTAEANQENLELPAGERASERPNVQPAVLDSVGELSELTVSSQQEVMQPSEPNVPAVEDPCDFKQMLAGILAAIQQNN
jgi:hypothetical protein